MCSTPLTQSEPLASKAAWATAWRGSWGPAEPARVLPNGSINVNPTLGEDQGTFEKAIQKTYSTPEAKEEARKMWPAYHDRWLSAAREQLDTSQTLPGVENYQGWIERNTQAGWLSKPEAEGGGLISENEMTQRYLDAMKGRSGWRKLAKKLPEKVARRFVSHSCQCIQ